MKGIILAGGTGTRLYPITLGVSKQLIPIYDKPMIYYPLSMLIDLKVTEILIITTPKDLPYFRDLLEDGSQLGLKINYAIQDKPLGLAQSFVIGAGFIGNDSVVLVLGDNIFHGESFKDQGLQSKKPNGGIIFAYQVSDPQRYGVVEFDKNYNAVSIEEKPKKPKSNYAIPGLYFFDNDVVEISRSLQPSKRGELEITDIIKYYLTKQKIKVKVVDKGSTWLDTGTVNSLMQASQYVQVIQERQGIKIGCIEESAYRNKIISKNQLKSIAKKLVKSGYGNYLLSLVE